MMTKKANRYTPPGMNYHDPDSENPTQAPAGETPEQRIRRIMRGLPPQFLHDPKLILQALKKAAQSQ